MRAHTVARWRIYHIMHARIVSRVIASVGAARVDDRSEDRNEVVLHDSSRTENPRGLGRPVKFAASDLVDQWTVATYAIGRSPSR